MDHKEAIADRDTQRPATHRDTLMFLIGRKHMLCCMTSVSQGGATTCMVELGLTSTCDDRCCAQHHFIRTGCKSLLKPKAPPHHDVCTLRFPS